MNHRLLHTPEGVRDIYEEELARKQTIEHSLSDVIHSYGYRSIQTPSFEFFDIFGKGISNARSRELYKFFDREGNTLVLRPDITPSIARAAAKYFTEDDRVIRLTYKGNVFTNNHSYQGRLKESTQLGAELIGDKSVDADAEVIALVVRCLKSLHLEDFQISVGHADIFRGLIQAADFSEEEEDEIRTLISNKNVYGVESFLDDKNLNPALRHLFDLVCNMFTSPDEWSQIMESAKAYPMVEDALKNLERLDSILKLYGVDHYVSFEPGLISSYEYYTGIIFSGYTYGSGQPVVRGGRYDNLLSYFGKEAAAIGFAFTVDQLMLATSRQSIALGNVPSKTVILFHESQRSNAIHMAEELRKAGQIVELVVKGDQEDLDVTAYEDDHTSVTTLS